MSRNNNAHTSRTRGAAVLIVIFIAVAVSTFRSEMSMVDRISLVTTTTNAG
ncbi:hypothetical protein [Burkholderia multivorans]|uniref:hypothetical protein n=1 Tax=Burkholderia multivorans TaxID=87883 RepID=UPI00143E886F|nr:hypothetical protein [Burkholderia multivorans]QIX18359.1 hypothetical protein FOB32_22820 [Burkholderia multivorans]